MAREIEENRKQYNWILSPKGVFRVAALIQPEIREPTTPPPLPLANFLTFCSSPLPAKMMENFQAARCSTLINPFLYNTPTGWIRRRFRRVPITRNRKMCTEGAPPPFPNCWSLYLPTFPLRHACAGRVERLVTLHSPHPLLQQISAQKVDSKLLPREQTQRGEGRQRRFRPNRPELAPAPARAVD